jgi:hypothetical protein
MAIGTLGKLCIISQALDVLDKYRHFEVYDEVNHSISSIQGARKKDFESARDMRVREASLKFSRPAGGTSGKF